jgi:hypothetical protein
MAIEALGRLFNIASVVAPVDLSSGAATGARVRLRQGTGVAFVYFAASAGTSSDLDVVTHFYSKREATLDNDETWVRSTQSAASEVDLGADEGENQVIAVVEVQANQLSDGYEWVSVNTTDSGTTAGKVGCVLAIVYDLQAMRKPENLATLL